MAEIPPELMGQLTEGQVSSLPTVSGLSLTPSIIQKQKQQQAQNQKRRSSTRSIKRKKFDDELVESSLVKSERGRFTKLPLAVPSVAPSIGGLTIHGTAPIPQSPIPVVPSATIPSLFPVPSATDTVSSPIALTPEVQLDVKPPETPIVAPPPEKKKSAGQKPTSAKGAASKRCKKVKPPPPAASQKDLGRWKPQDDLALITAVQQTNDLTAVHLGVPFSCKFTLKEIQERWYALLYDPVLSKLAVNAIKQLHPDIVAAEQAKALFGKDEEALLGTITSASQPTIETFHQLLSKNPTIFHPARTPKILNNHWLLMKQYHLLPDQSVQPMPRGDHVLNFSDAEDLINEEDLKEPRDEVLEHELAVADRRQKQEIRTLEQELPKWQVLVDSVTGVSPPDFDTQTLAVLRGRLVRYLMRSREITLGRATKDNPIDVDLALEGPAWKISRRQGVIKLRTNGDFFIANEGKRPIYIDGKPVLTGNKQKLNNNSVVEISCLRFIFLINQELIGIIRNDSQKLSS